jgi:hypothetical protein
MSARILQAINTLALALVIYAASYFALARPGVTITIGGQWIADPDYFGVPEFVFRPLHAFDRAHMRPHLWQGVFSRAE